MEPLRYLIKNHEINPEEFLNYVHNIDASSLNKDSKLNNELKKLPGSLYIYTNGSKTHAINVLKNLGIDLFLFKIFDIKDANYIPKPDIVAYREFIKKYDINPNSSIMFDDIAKNLVPAKNLGFTSIWIDAGYENFSDDIKSSKKFLDYTTTDLHLFLEKVNKGNI